MEKDSRIYIAGHSGLVGSAIVRTLKARGYSNLIGRRSSELDLTRQKQVEEFFAAEKPEYVFFAAAKVGGLVYNNLHPADSLYVNLMIEGNVLHGACENHVKKLVFLGSSCIYPKLARQPIKEDSLLTGKLEPMDEAYSLAKISGVKLCEYLNRQYGTKFTALMPCNVYGPGDNFAPESSHVVPALIRKFHEAKTSGADLVTLWGTGAPTRDFLYSDDLADACVFLMDRYDGTDWFNVGGGKDLAIRDLAAMIADVVGFRGQIVYDASMPDGSPRKLLDPSKLFQLGWRPKVGLRRGLEETYCDYLANGRNYRQ